MEGEGYVVDAAENGEEAIRKTNVDFFNLALIDIRLPDMNGTELLTKMKETTPKMVKIILTGYPALENSIEAVNKGADAYILKPFKMESVLNTIKEHVKRQKEAKKFSEGKVAEFIEARAREWEEERTVIHKRPH